MSEPVDYQRAADSVRSLISRVKPEPYHAEKGDCERAAKLCEAWPLVESLIAAATTLLVDEGSHCPPDEEGYDRETCNDCINQKALSGAINSLRGAVPR